MNAVKIRSMVTRVGPGIAIAATGVGAADLVAATVAGSRYGNGLAWAIVVGALLTYVLNEGVARWHLATGTSVLEGWARYLGRPALVFFVLYLFIWTLRLTRADFDGEGQRLTVVSPKTKKQGKPMRVVPLFPELEQLASEA